MNFICGRAAVNSPPFSKGDVCVSRQRDSDGFSHWQFKVPCAVNPLPSLSPVGSSLLGREPTSVSFAIFRCRVFRVPSAAEPLTTVPLFQRGMSASADRGILMGSSHWQFKVPCAVNPLPSLSPVGSSLLGREPAVESIARYGTASLGSSSFAASILRLWRAPFGLKGRRFYGQAKRLLYFRPNLEVLCRTSISKGLHAGNCPTWLLLTFRVKPTARAPLEKGAGRRPGDGSASKRQVLRSRQRDSDGFFSLAV